MLKKSGQSTNHYQCWGCTKVKREDANAFANRTIPIIAVDATTNLYKDDPIHPRSEHFCEPFELTELLSEQYRRKASKSVRKGVRPRRAYTELRASVAEELGTNPELRDGVLSKIKLYGNYRSGLYKSYASKYPTITGINDIPDVLKCTFKGILIVKI